MKNPTSFWTNHFALTLLLKCMMASQLISIAPYLLPMGHQPLLRSLAVSRLPLLTKQPTLDEEETYLSEVSRIVTWL